MEKYIYTALTSYDFSQPATICSQVNWKGSVPRRDYPVMLVLSNGKTVGTVGGGEMEYRVIEAAKKVLETGNPVLLSENLSGKSPDSTHSICGGRTLVLIEPFTEAIRDFWRRLDILNTGKTSKTVLIQISTKELNITRQIINDSFDAAELPQEIQKALNRSFSENKSLSGTLHDQYFLIQYLTRPALLHLFGAGHVAQAVAELLHFIDLDVNVYDDRSDLATTERFPFAEELVTAPIDELPVTTTINSGDFALIATRGHRHDFELMKWLLSTDLSYLGLMSSRHKWKVLRQGLLKAGFSEEQLRLVHSPVGIDIGSETVPEIAVSIVSELIHHYRQGGWAIQSMSKSND